MANDLLAMKTRISAELARPDILSSNIIIADAITTAISVYQNTRFRFSETTPNAPPTFPTVAGRYIYTAADNPNIGSVLKLDRVMITIGNTLQELDRESATDIILYNDGTTMQGQPSSYAYEGNQLLLAAVPNDVWTITLGLFKLVAAPASDSEAANPWMTDAELLIRSRAKYEIATHRLRNPSMAAAMSPDPPGATWRAWRDLLSEANRVASVGRIRPMRF